MVLAVMAVVAGFAALNVQTAMKNARVDAAYAATLNQLRQGRQAAVDRRVVYIVRFQLPRTIITEVLQAGTRTTVGQIDLPSDMEYRAEPGIPTTQSLTPDNFGSGSLAVDFSIDYGGGGTELYFQPDGSAKDNLGRINNGVLYMARPGQLSSARAVSLFGATGRIKGWRLETYSDGTARWL